MKKIIKVKTDDSGAIEAVRFEGNTTFTDIETAVRLAEQGKIKNVHAVSGPSGKYIRSNADGKENNNLSELD